MPERILSVRTTWPRRDASTGPMIHAKAYPALNGHVSRHVEPARGLHNGGQRADAIAGWPDSQEAI
jgi:hypothetical protein